MTREEIIDGLEIYTVGRSNKAIVHITVEELQKFIEAIKALEQEPCEDADVKLIHTQGLDEGIWCAMCTNSMKSDRGCDGGCVVNKNMYKAVMDTIKKCIQPTTKNDLYVTPQAKTGHCKDCKRWKDSDGVFRRGVGAESKCPINRREVFEGNGYCYMYEPQEGAIRDETTRELLP